jgi:hypothetical protein
MRPSGSAGAGGCRARRAATAVALHQVLRERARDAPCLERVRRVHQLEVQVRGGRVPGVADTADQLDEACRPRRRVRAGEGAGRLSLHPQGRPAGGLRPPSGPATTHRSPQDRPHPAGTGRRYTVLGSWLSRSGPVGKGAIPFALACFTVFLLAVVARALSLASPISTGQKTRRRKPMKELIRVSLFGDAVDCRSRRRG